MDSHGGPRHVEPTDLFPDLSPAAREMLAADLARRTFAKGDQVIGKGDRISGAYFVLEGRLRVFTLTPTGKEATLYVIDPGETCVVAINSLFNNLLYPAWVQAEAETTVGILSGTVYRRLFERERPVQDLTVHALSTVVFRLMEELEEVHGQTLDQRLAGFLLNRASGAGVVARTQQEIADHLGTTREVVARSMAKLAARGLVKTGRGRIEILAAQGLAAVIRRG